VGQGRIGESAEDLSPAEEVISTETKTGVDDSIILGESSGSEMDPIDSSESSPETDSQGWPLMDQDQNQDFGVDPEETKRMFSRLQNASKALMEQGGSSFRFDDRSNSEDVERPGAQFVGGFQSVSDDPEL